MDVIGDEVVGDSGRKICCSGRQGGGFRIYGAIPLKFLSKIR